MKETTLNTAMVNSIKKAFEKEFVDCTKYSASRFGMSGFPDVRGVLAGQSFYIEGKMLNELKGKGKKKVFSISKRDGNMSGCSDVQIERMTELYNAGATVLMAYYKHYGQKGVYLIPRTHIKADKQLISFMDGDKFYDKFFCPYIKGQVYDCRKLLLDVISGMYDVNSVKFKRMVKNEISN
jgi:hypothetical protein